MVDGGPDERYGAIAISAPKPSRVPSTPRRAVNRTGGVPRAGTRPLTSARSFRPRLRSASVRRCTRATPSVSRVEAGSATSPNQCSPWRRRASSAAATMRAREAISSVRVAALAIAVATRSDEVAHARLGVRWQRRGCRRADDSRAPEAAVDDDRHTHRRTDAELPGRPSSSWRIEPADGRRAVGIAALRYWAT